MYRRAGIFAFPSLDEGFGMPVLDAMARGVAVVASRRSAIPEVAGEAALLVDPEDVEELGAALASLASSEALRRDLAQRGLARAAEMTWDAGRGANLERLPGVAIVPQGRYVGLRMVAASCCAARLSWIKSASSIHSAINPPIISGKVMMPHSTSENRADSSGHHVEHRTSTSLGEELKHAQVAGRLRHHAAQTQKHHQRESFASGRGRSRNL